MEQSSACENQIQDLESLAMELLQFEPQRQQKAKRDRMIKKNNKKQKQIKNDEKAQKAQHPQGSDDEVDFHLIAQNKPLGSHSIYVKTYGCSHNISDSQFMIGQLVDYGYHMVNSVEQADLVLINSCTVKNPSQDAFLSLVCKAKKIRKPVVVAGCVPQGDQNIPQLSEVSALGVTQIDRVVQVVEETLKGNKIQLMSKKELPSLDLPKVRKNQDIQIIPINAGCLGACTYCKTVFARGKLLSYASEAITTRVTTVVKQGVKQIWLTSQDTGAYGRDINSNISELLISLCEELRNHDRIMMRIGMTNPPYMLDHLHTIAHFLNHPRVFSFVHVPVQAGNNTVLNKMNRQYTVQEFKKVCDFFLKHVPDVTIATDIICGFAQETEEEFEDTMKLIEQYKFRVVNINQFYLRPGTPAGNLKQIPTKIKKERSTRLTKLFRSYEKFEYMIGRQERVWINETQLHKGQKILVGHTKNYTKVIFPFDEQLLYKQVIIKVTKAYEWHIQGEILQKDVQPLPIDDNYVKMMKEDIKNEKQKIEQKHVEKLAKIKEKTDKIKKQLQQQNKKQQSQKKMKLEQNEVKSKNTIQIQKKQQITKNNNMSYLYYSMGLLLLGSFAHFMGF